MKCNWPNWRNCEHPNTCCDECTDLNNCVQSCVHILRGPNCHHYEKAPGGVESSTGAELKTQTNDTTGIRSEQEIRQKLEQTRTLLEQSPYHAKQIRTEIRVLEWVLGR